MSSCALEMKGLSAPKTTLSPFNNKYLTARHIKIKWKSSRIYCWCCCYCCFHCLCLLQFFTNRCVCVCVTVSVSVNNTHTAFTVPKVHWYIDTTTNMPNKCSLFNDCLYKIPPSTILYLHRLSARTFRSNSLFVCKH